MATRPHGTKREESDIRPLETPWLSTSAERNKEAYHPHSAPLGSRFR